MTLAIAAAQQPFLHHFRLLEDLRLRFDYEQEHNLADAWPCVFDIFDLLKPEDHAALQTIRFDIRDPDGTSLVPCDINLWKAQALEDSLLRLPNLKTVSFAPLGTPGVVMEYEDQQFARKVFPRLAEENKLEFCHGDDVADLTWLKSFIS